MDTLNSLYKALLTSLEFCSIYIYAFSRRFYLKAIHFLISMCVPWELNPQPFALLMQCSTTEPQAHLVHDFAFLVLK